MSKELFNWNDSNYSDCKNNDWLLNTSKVQWTIGQRADNSDNVFIVISTGYVGNNRANNARAARPVVHLKSNIKITSGTGSSTNPFVLG